MEKSIKSDFEGEKKKKYYDGNLLIAPSRENL
jgi:hypothetical protein